MEAIGTAGGFSLCRMHCIPGLFGIWYDRLEWPVGADRRLLERRNGQPSTIPQLNELRGAGVIARLRAASRACHESALRGEAWILERPTARFRRQLTAPEDDRSQAPPSLVADTWARPPTTGVCVAHCSRACRERIDATCSWLSSSVSRRASFTTSSMSSSVSALDSLVASPFS